MQVDGNNNQSSNQAPAPAVTPAPGDAQTPPPSEGEAPAPATETPKTEEQKRQEIEFGKRFAALSRRERAILEKEKQAQAHMEKVQAWENAQKQARENPLAFMEAHGLTYQELTELVLNDGKPSTEAQLAALQKRLDDEAAERRKRDEAQEQARINQAIADHKQSIKAHVETNAEAFELIQANNAYDLVYSVQDHWFDKTLKEKGKGEILPIEAACKAVEEHLESEAKKILGLKKFQAKLNETKADTPQGALKTPQAPKTLTNESTAGSPPPNQPLLTREESLARAAQKLRWT